MKLLIDKLAELATRPHHVNDEDCWYSCPMSGQCCNDKEVGCNCGAETTT